jgi:hypothetical protein
MPRDNLIVINFNIDSRMNGYWVDQSNIGKSQVYQTEAEESLLHR